MVKMTNFNPVTETAEYVVDAVSDISDLPTDVGMGSSALVIATGSVYILGGDGEWAQL